MLSDAGFTSDEYGLLAAGTVDVTQTAGDGDEGIMRNLMGLRHSLGILIESAVEQDVTNGLDELTTAAAVNRRRVESHATVIDCAAAFMRTRGQEVAAATAGSVTRKIAEGRDRSAPVYFQGQDEDTTVAQDAPAHDLDQSAAVWLRPDHRAGREIRRSPRPSRHHDSAATRWRACAAGSGGRAGHRALLDARNEDRHAVAGTPLDTCVLSAAAGPTRSARRLPALCRRPAATERSPGSDLGCSPPRAGSGRYAVAGRTQDSTRATACSSTQAISSSASSKKPRRASSTSHAEPRAANSNWCSSIWRARSIPAWTMLRSRSIP